MGHIHSIYDTDPHFKIDAITRLITNMSEKKTSIVQSDHNSERFTFECPRMVDGHDMQTCNQVRVHYMNIDQQTRERHYGVYEVDDLQLSPEDENVVICSWLISANATKYVGPLSFTVEMVCRTGTTIDYAWHTAVFAGFNVVESINGGEPIIIEYADIMEAWKQELAAKQIVSMEQTVVGESDGGENVWTATYGDGRTADFVVRNGNAGVTNPAGEDYGSVKSGGDVTIEDGVISVKWPGDDSGTAYSKTVPRGASGVAEIKEIGGMTRKCTNLLPYPYTETTKTINGVTYTDNGDGTLTVNGTSTGQATFFFAGNEKFSLPVGTYTFSLNYVIPTGAIVWLYKTSESRMIASIYAGEQYKTFTLAKEESFNVYIHVPAGVSFPNVVLKPMLNEGSTALPYEPYFEGLRSAPVTEVESVGARLEIPEAVQALDGYGEGNPEDITEYNYINLRDGTYHHLGGLTDGAWVALATPEITDISAIIGGKHVEIEEGDTLTFVNEHAYAVPSVVDFSASADVRVIPQSLSAAQKGQARDNIGIHVVDSVPSDLSAYAVGDIILVTE